MQKFLIFKKIYKLNKLFLKCITIFWSISEFYGNLKFSNAEVDMNGPENRVYYYPVGFNLANIYVGPSVGTLVSADSQVTNFISPCQFMHPITIQFIGMYPNSGETPIKNIVCDSVSLQKSLEKFKLGSDTVKVVKACTDIAQILMDSETSYSIFNGVNNITIWLEGSKLINVVKQFNEDLPNKIPQILDRDVRYQYEPTIFGKDVIDRIGISSYLFQTTTFPFKFSIDYSKILPGITSYGTNVPIIDFSVNITLSYEYSTQKNSLTTFWTPPRGFAGFFPMFVPNDKFANVVLWTTYTEIGKQDKFVAWGNINIPMTSPLVRIIPPSRIPDSDILCTSNYDFYYPTTNEPLGTVEDFPKQLETILDEKSESKIIRNTISVQSYWNKIPFGAKWYENGFPVGSANSQWIETGNYFGGCYFNGTFPLVPSITNKGFENTICSTQSETISDVYKTAFYPPPLEFLQYGVSNLQTMISAILQYGVEKSARSNSVFNHKSDIEFLGSYPSYHIIGASSPLQLSSPYQRLNVPFVLYSGRDLVAGDPFFNFNFQYMQDRFGHCAEINGCWQCSNPRVIPWKTNIIDQMNFTEFCASNITEIPNSDMIAYKFFYGTFGENLASQASSGFQSCLKSEPDRWRAVGTNTTTFTLKSGEYHSNTIFVYNTLSNDTCCSPMNTYFFYQYYYTIVTDVYQPIQITQIAPYTDPFIGGILPGIFMNREFSYSFYIDVYPDSTWTKDSSMKLRSWLMCPAMKNIDLNIFPENVILGDIQDSGGKIGVSITIPPFTFNKYYDSPTFCVIRAFIFVNDKVESENYSVLKNIEIEQYKKEKPRVYSSSEGMHEYVQWILVNNGFISKSSKLIEPFPGKTTILDALYLPVNVVHQYNFTITPFLFSAVAVNSPIFSPESQIFEMVIAGQHNRFGLRLPPTQSTWYVFTRSADKWDQGCFVRCRGDMSRSPYASWCLPEINDENPFEYNLCNYTIVNTNSEITDSQIEDLIAVVTNPISYLSYVDTISLVNALFSLPVSFYLVWKKYFGVIYNIAVDLQTVPFNQDYPFAQSTTLAVINRILSKYYYRELLDFDTKIPFNSIQRIYTITECFLIDGIDNLALNTTDMIGTANPLPKLSSENLEVILSIYQGVASRKSYTQGIHGKYFLNSEKTGNSVFSSTFNQIDMLKQVNVGRIQFPSIDLSRVDSKKILFHQGVYYRINESLYNKTESILGFKSCTKSLNTITVIRTGTYLSNYMLINEFDQIEKYPLALSTFVLCTLEFELWDLNEPVKLSFFAEYKEELDYSDVKCTSMLQDHSGLSDSLCETETFKHYTNQTIEFSCSCRAITYYGLKGKPYLYIPTNSNNDLSLLFSKQNPNIFQPFIIISNPSMTSSCSDYLPINVQLKNIPVTIPNENLTLKFKCISPISFYLNLEFCEKFERELQNLEYSFSREGTNVNFTYIIAPNIIQEVQLPENLSFWRPENQEQIAIQGISGLTVYLNITLELSDFGIENELPDLFEFALFDILVFSNVKNLNSAPEFGEISRTYLQNSFIDIPGAYTKSNLPISSIKLTSIPYSIPYNSPEYCSDYLESYFSNGEIQEILLEMSNRVIIKKNTHFIPNLLEPLGKCKLSITKSEYIKGGTLKCATTDTQMSSDSNLIEQPISILNITKLSTSSYKSTQNKIIIHNQTIIPEINAISPLIISKNYPRILIETDTSKTIEQIVAKNGYCEEISLGCTSCRGLRSYQADFQYSNQEFKYLCAETSDINELPIVNQSILHACNTDGSYWGRACSTQQSNSTISGNTTYTEFDVISQDELHYLIFAVGIRSNVHDAIECKSFTVSFTEKELPMHIIPRRVPKTISQASETYLHTRVKYIGNDEWNKSKGLKFISYAFFENTGYIELETNPQLFDIDEFSYPNNVDISIQINIKNSEVDIRDNKVSIILLIIKKEVDEVITDVKLNSLIKKNNIQNLSLTGDYLSYLWKDIPFEHELSLIKLNSLLYENPGIKQVIPVSYKTSNLGQMANRKYSLLATSEGDQTLKMPILLIYLSLDVPQYLRLPINREIWLVHLIIHNEDNELLCGLDCSNIRNIDKHLENMFCVTGNSPKCKYMTIKTKDEKKTLNESDIKKEYIDLYNYFDKEPSIGDEKDRAMIGSLLVSNLEYFTELQIDGLLNKLLNNYTYIRENTNGISIFNLYLIWKVMYFVFSKSGNNLNITSSWDLNSFKKLALKSECAFNNNYPNLIIDLLDYIIKYGLTTDVDLDESLISALSVNQWVMSNTFGKNISLVGELSKIEVNTIISSELQLISGIKLNDEFEIPSIIFDEETFKKINVILIKNIYYEINQDIVIYDGTVAKNLFKKCHDVRYGFTLIKPSVNNYLNNLEKKIREMEKSDDIYQKTYEIFVSRCGYEYQIYNLENKVKFAIRQEYTPSVVSGRFIKYQCAAKGSNNIWDLSKCETSNQKGQVVCSCNSIGEYALKMTYQSSLTNVQISLSHNPGSIQEVNINGIFYKVTNGKFYYKQQVISILSNEIITITPNNVLSGKYILPINDYSKYDIVKKVTFRQEGVLGVMKLTSEEYNISIEGSSIICDGFNQGNYVQNSTLTII